jgi:hypothetical protein
MIPFFGSDFRCAAVKNRTINLKLIDHVVSISNIVMNIVVGRMAHVRVQVALGSYRGLPYLNEIVHTFSSLSSQIPG